MKLRARVIQSAELVLERDGQIGPLEFLQQLGFLHVSHVEQWKRGNEFYTDLESHIQCGEKKLIETWNHFFDWVQEKKLEAIEVDYQATSRYSDQTLHVTVDGEPEKEKFYRTHFRPADLSPAKKKRLDAKQTKAPELVVFETVADRTQCSGCGSELCKGELLFLEKQQPLCLNCADLDHLEFLPSGDTALTRRTRKYSSLVAVVVRFSKARKRYERQGILATVEAIVRAEAECADDADQRAERRKADAVRRLEEDKKLIADMAAVIAAIYPGCPPSESREIANHTALRGSGRVGRSVAGRSLAEDAIHLAVRAWIRHQYTDYDKLLMRGVPRDEARELIAASVDRTLRKWM